MSQAPLQNQEPQAAPMSSTFRSVPINPYQDRAEATRQQVLEMEAANKNTAPQQSTGSPAASVPPQEQVAPQSPAQAEPQPVPQYTPIQPQQQYTDPAVLQQLQQERQYLMQQNAQQQEAINNLIAANQEYTALKQRAELQAALTDDAFGELSTVDVDDARAIGRAVLNATQAAFAPMQEELARTRKLVEDKTGEQQARMEQARLLSLRDKVLAAHPDFEYIQNTQEYQNFMSQRDGLSSQTRDQRAAQEFRAGNTDYVIDMLKQFKSNVPTVSSIQTVAPVQAATGTPVATPSAQPLTLGELNTLYQLRKISYDEYMEKLKAIRAAG